MQNFFPMSKLTVTCANMFDLLFRLNVNGIALHHLCRKDEVTASFCIHQVQYNLAVEMIAQSGGKLVNTVPATAYLLLRGLLRRPILILGAILIVFLTIFVPSRILFVTVTGNERVPQRQILATASECGVYFGVPRNEIRSEQIKNRLLAAMPELKWVGVNTYGCVAQISVRERATTEKQANNAVISSLVASYDGVIKEITVRNGNPVCQIGQAVKKGQLLVSGYADCGRCIYATRADGDIFAQTRRTLDVSILQEANQKEQIQRTQRKYGLIIGKKRINFYKGSGIYDTTCDRMYEEYPLTLPGGFQLPIALTIQEEIDYHIIPAKLDLAELEQTLDRCANEYLEQQMIAGKVSKKDYQLRQADGSLHLLGEYICYEMIGQTRSEEIVNNYGEND